MRFIHRVLVHLLEDRSPFSQMAALNLMYLTGLPWHLQQEWKSLSCVLLLWPHGLYTPWDSPGQSAGVGSLSLLQGIFPTQGLNPGLPHCRWISLPAEPQGKPRNTRVGSLSLLQQIFLTQESNWGLLHCRQILYQPSYQAAETYILITYRRAYRWVGDARHWWHHLWPLDHPRLKGNLPMGQWSLSQLFCFT